MGWIRYDASVDAEAPNESLTLSVKGPLRLSSSREDVYCLLFVFLLSKHKVLLLFLGWEIRHLMSLCAVVLFQRRGIWFVLYHRISFCRFHLTVREPYMYIFYTRRFVRSSYHSEVNLSLTSEVNLSLTSEVNLSLTLEVKLSLT